MTIAEFYRRTTTATVESHCCKRHHNQTAFADETSFLVLIYVPTDSSTIAMASLVWLYRQRFPSIERPQRDSSEQWRCAV